VAELEDLLALVREARPHLARTGPETEAWLSRLEERHDDLHDLVERLLESEPETAAEACAALWPFWWQRGHMREGRELLERAAALDGGDKAPVLKGLGTIAFRQGDLEVAERAFRERFELVEAGGSGADLADACSDIARVALRRGDLAEVRRWSAASRRPRAATIPRRSGSHSTCARPRPGWKAATTRRASSTWVASS
jgi:tetratricopeptide (TPR) repeat protein